MDKECQAPALALTGLFQKIISDVKSSGPVWEELSKQAVKLQSQLKNTVIVLGMFLDAFQKVADLANNSPGATREIGAGLTRLCVRQRNLESKLKALAGSLSECLVQSLQDSVEEWKKSAVQLDKDHSKEYKKLQQEIKKASSETLRLKKKAKKAGGSVKTDGSEIFDVVESKYAALEDSEAAALRSALVLQRNHFCQFFNHMKPVLVGEMEMLEELEHMKEVIDNLTELSINQNTLPLSSEQIVIDLKSATSCTTATAVVTAAGTAATAAGTAVSTLLMPPAQLGSQVSLSSQHSSSHRSSRLSESSGSLQSIQSALQQQQSTHVIGQNSINQTLPSRCVSSSLAGISSIEYRQMSSVSSQDSGFVSQEIPTSLSGDHLSPMTNATMDPPHSFTHPNLAVMYADSPDRGFTASDGGLAAACMRPHTISAAYSHVRARPAASDVFSQQNEHISQEFPSQAQAEALRKRGSMTVQQQQAGLNQLPSHQQQQHQQQHQLHYLQQQQYIQQQHQQQQYNASVAYNSEQRCEEQTAGGGTLKCKGSNPHEDPQNLRYEIIPAINTARNSVRSSSNTDHLFARGERNGCSCQSSTENYSTPDTVQFLNSNHPEHHSHAPHYAVQPCRPESFSGPVIMRQSSGSHYAVPNVTGIRRSVSSEGSISDGSTADIYARPSLLLGRRPGAGPVPVATPSIPGVGGINPRGSQRSSTRITEEMEEEIQQVKREVAEITQPDQSLPQLKTTTPLATTTTECINLNGLLENIESIIVLSNSDTSKVTRSQREPPNTDLPPPPTFHAYDLQYSERPSSRHGNIPAVISLDSSFNDDFPPPPLSLMMMSPAGGGVSHEYMKVNPTSSLSGSGSTAESFVAYGNSGKVGPQGPGVGELEEEGSLLAAIRNVKLRKTTDSQN